MFQEVPRLRRSRRRPDEGSASLLPPPPAQPSPLRCSRAAADLSEATPPKAGMTTVWWEGEELRHLAFLVKAFRARPSGRRKTQDRLEGPCLFGARVVGETEGRASETPPRMDGWLPCQQRLLSGIRASLQLELLEGSEGFEEPRSRPEFQCASAGRTDGCTHLQRRRSLRHRLHLPLLRRTFSPSLRPPSTDPKPAEPSGWFGPFQP